MPSSLSCPLLHLHKSHKGYDFTWAISSLCHIWLLSLEIFAEVLENSSPEFYFFEFHWQWLFTILCLFLLILQALNAEINQGSVLESLLYLHSFLCAPSQFQGQIASYAKAHTFIPPNQTFPMNFPTHIYICLPHYYHLNL